MGNSKSGNAVWLFALYVSSGCNCESLRVFTGQLLSPNRVENASQPSSLGGDLVVSTVFLSKLDAENTRMGCRFCEQYFGTWLESAKRLNLSTLIFHNGLPSRVIAMKEGPTTSFINVQLGGASMNDERFKIYYTYLTNQHLSEYPSFKVLAREQETRGPEGLHNIFFTDIRDVEFKRNPFELVHAKPDLLYVGTERRAWRKWLWGRIEKCKLNAVRFNYSNMFNAGILGGEISLVTHFLHDFVSLQTSIPRQAQGRNCNMAIFNAAVVEWFESNQVFTGSPLHSKFLRYEFHRSDVYIRHK